jgi:hypothetical protein
MPDLAAREFPDTLNVGGVRKSSDLKIQFEEWLFGE